MNPLDNAGPFRLGGELMAIATNTFNRLAELQLQRLTRYGEQTFSATQRMFEQREMPDLFEMQTTCLQSFWQELEASNKAAQQILTEAMADAERAVQSAFGNGHAAGPAAQAAPARPAPSRPQAVPPAASPGKPTGAAPAAAPAAQKQPAAQPKPAAKAAVAEVVLAREAAPVFELYRDKAGEYRFRLKDGDATVLTSEGYKSKKSARNGIKSVCSNAANDARYRRGTNAGGKHQFNLRAGNNQVIGSSCAFPTEAALDEAVDRLKASIGHATVDDKTA